MTDRMTSSEMGLQRRKDCWGMKELEWSLQSTLGLLKKGRKYREICDLAGRKCFPGDEKKE